ncbi:MAG: hypothetical protein GF344_03250 [Chitinivibrionales bacterium]|nr:hypothetical protein [Chitinivibrionales bacterium]MBD3356094.1 hypothetical protein [Chitinivibrionales bacterium]
MIPKIKGMRPNLPIVDLRRGVHLRKMGNDHTHGECHHHGAHKHSAHHDDENHGGKDPHIWLSP